MIKQEFGELLGTGTADCHIFNGTCNRHWIFFTKNEFHKYNVRKQAYVTNLFANCSPWNSINIMFCVYAETRGPLILYRSPEFIGHAELETGLDIHDYIRCISFHPCRSIIKKQIWPCHKNVHGQPSVIIWTNLVVLEYPLLYTKFQGHRPLGSEEGDFWMFLLHMGLKPSWSSDPEYLNKFSSQLHMKFGF